MYPTRVTESSPGLEELLAIQTWVNCAIAKIASGARSGTQSSEEHTARDASDFARAAHESPHHARHPRKFTKHPVRRQFERGGEHAEMIGISRDADDWNVRTNVRKKKDDEFGPVDISRRLV